MPPKVTLTDAQKYQFCLYARDNKRTRPQYVNWIEDKWGVRIDESTVTRILKTTEQRLRVEVANPVAKRHKSVRCPQLELALKEFLLIYQRRTIISDSLLIEKAKQLADALGIQGKIQFSAGWLQKFKARHGIRHRTLEGEAASADQAAIVNSMPLLRDRCANYPLERIYNMDETALFYR
jgi:Tc5 transposase DNA-binding domain